LNGYKLLVVQTKSSGSPETLVAADTVGAGIGEDVLITRGSMARGILRDANTPIDAVVVGIIDSVEVDEKLLN
jgi:ethanolamine utilization protein EutN